MTRHYLAIAGIITVMGIAGQFDYEEERRQTVQYCEMVRLWKQTGGQAGWPAYDGEDVCRDTQSNEKGTRGEQ